MTEASPVILAPMSPGEILDRLTILELKLAACRTEADREAISFGIEALNSAWHSSLGTDPKDHPAWPGLLTINTELWRIEDEVRGFERVGEFGPDFIAAARAVYKTNDRRAAHKRRVDEDLGSRLIDLKFHESE